MPNTNLPPYTSIKVTDESGNFTPEFDLYFDQFNQYFEKNLGSSGYVLPSVNQDQLDKISNDAASGTIWYKNDEAAETDRLVVKIGSNLYRVNLTLIP